MKRILAIGLDSAEHSLIEKWTEDGSLPNLKMLKQAGAYGILQSFAKHLPGSGWYSFYLGQQPGMHGLYSYFSWQPERMKAITPSSKWLKLTPFWHRFQDGGPRGVIVNIPNAFVLAPFNGIELISLVSDHALTPLRSYPSGVARQIGRIHNHRLYPEENYGLVTFKQFLRTRDELLAVTSDLKNIYIKMMMEESWDIFMAVFPTLHRAGHMLWSTVNIVDIKTPEEKEEATNALKQVYMACDAVIGDLVEAAGANAMRMLFSFNGMHDNHSREVIVQEMLDRVLNARPNAVAGKWPPGLLLKFRRSIPAHWRHKVKGMLPLRWRHRLTIFWRLGQLNWAKTRAFIIPLEAKVGIRINLIGREVRGIVQPGREYDDLCKMITDGLLTFVDADTGKPLISEINFSGHLYKGKRLDWLPDLLASWNDESAAGHRLITSPVFGDIPWPTPGHNPEGRSGNHMPEGFLIAHGPGVRRGEIKDAHILDLAPTILSLLGEPVPADMNGNVLSLLNQDTTRVAD